MPELPEVETVLRTLENLIKDRKIIDVKILYPNIIVGNIEEFKNKVIGQQFKNFKRRGKFLLFELNDICLVSHLRMEGKYFYQPKHDPLSKHTHVIFELDNGYQLRYDDVRKFGRMELIALDNEYIDFHGLGVEPFSNYFTVDYLKAKMMNSKKNLKQFLLDQSNIAGIGNIYADEICFRLRLAPWVKVADLNDDQRTEMIDAVRDILSLAIENGGSTIRSYTSSLGVTGRFQLVIDVYGRDGEKCHVCGNIIQKMKLAQRGTHYCPHCQKG